MGINCKECFKYIICRGQLKDKRCTGFQKMFYNAYDIDKFKQKNNWDSYRKFEKSDLF